MIYHSEHLEILLITFQLLLWGARTWKNLIMKKSNIWGARDIHLGRSWIVLGAHQEKFGALVHGALWLWGEVTSTLLHNAVNNSSLYLSPFG